MSGTRRIDVLANQPIRRWLSCHMFTRSSKRALESRLSFSVEGRARLIPTLTWCLALYNCGTGKSNISSVFVIKVRPMEKTNNPVRFKVYSEKWFVFVLFPFRKAIRFLSGICKSNHLGHRLSLFVERLRSQSGPKKWHNLSAATLQDCFPVARWSSQFLMAQFNFSYSAGLFHYC